MSLKKRESKNSYSCRKQIWERFLTENKTRPDVFNKCLSSISQFSAPTFYRCSQKQLIFLFCLFGHVFLHLQSFSVHGCEVFPQVDTSWRKEIQTEHYSLKTLNLIQSFPPSLWTLGVYMKSGKHYFCAFISVSRNQTDSVVINLNLSSLSQLALPSVSSLNDAVRHLHCVLEKREITALTVKSCSSPFSVSWSQTEVIFSSSVRRLCSSSLCIVQPAGINGGIWLSIEKTGGTALPHASPPPYLLLPGQQGKF